MFHELKVIDCHVHNAMYTNEKELALFLDGTGTDHACILACSHFRCLSLIPKAMIMKAMYPGKFYVFGAPDLSAFYLHPDDLGLHLREHGQEIVSMGCDGIKLLEAKPQWRKFFPIPDFDLPVWEPFWSWAEENEIPLLWHVNDPENFWDREHAPSFAIAKGWLYDESYVNNEAQYSQVLNVMERHPQLQVCFAHFFFMSAQLDRLASWLDRFPGMRIDLTPGIEMYENFSSSPDQTRQFFERYHDRIFYGTDIGGRCFNVDGSETPFDTEENLRRPTVVQCFLSGNGGQRIESDGHYLIDRPPFQMMDLQLKSERLEEILSRNFQHFAGFEPKVPDPEAILLNCKHVSQKIKQMAESVRGFVPDYSSAEAGIQYFSHK